MIGSKTAIFPDALKQNFLLLPAAGGNYGVKFTLTISKVLFAVHWKQGFITSFIKKKIIIIITSN